MHRLRTPAAAHGEGFQQKIDCCSFTPLPLWPATETTALNAQNYGGPLPPSMSDLSQSARDSWVMRRRKRGIIANPIPIDARDLFEQQIHDGRRTGPMLLGGRCDRPGENVLGYIHLRLNRLHFTYGLRQDAFYTNHISTTQELLRSMDAVL